MNQESEPLSFEAPPEQDIEISAPAQTKPKEKTISQFSNLSPSERRLEILNGIKKGEIDINNFPSYMHSHLKNFAKLIVPSKIDGKLVVSPDVSPNSREGQLKPKVDRLIISGKAGDLIDAQNNPMWTELADSIFRELEPLLHDDHPSRKLEALDKSGKLDDMINAHMRMKNFDLFAVPSWFKGGLKMVALQRRSEASQEKRGNIKEDLMFESIRYQLKSILDSDPFSCTKHQ
jgi:hypothetical protein